jgi:ketosteroid isomerase-like protein
VPIDSEYSERFLEVTRASATKDDSLSIVHAAFDAIIRGDFEAFGETLAGDVELKIGGFGAAGLHALDGAWRGRAAVVAATRRNFATLAEQKPEIASMIREGDRVAVLLRENGGIKSNGQAYSVRGVQWFTFAGGKIARIDEIIANYPL